MPLRVDVTARLLPVLLLAWAGCACGQTFDFESDAVPEALTIEHASITRDEALVISGAGSLVCDTTAGGGAATGWNEFLRTDHACLPLSDGHRYRISFDWRVSEPGERERYYYLLRSYAQRESGGLADQFFSLDPRGESLGRFVGEFVPLGSSDFFFIVGLRGQSRMVVDGFTVEDLGPLGTSFPVPPIKTGGPCPYAAELSWLADFDRRHGVARRMQDALVVLHDERMRDEPTVHKMITDFGADYVDWAAFPFSLAQGFGVRTGRQGMETDGYYRREGPQYWANRQRYFFQRGFLIDLSGVTPQNDFWGEGGYSTCLNGERWRAAWLASMLDRLADWADISADNLTWAPFYRSGCFCNACNRLFLSYLRSRYAEAELAEWGVGEAFHILRYASESPARGYDMLADPVLREYHRFQNLSHFANLTGCIVACKKRGLDMGRAIAFSGNQTGMDYVPTALGLPNICDHVQVECTENEHNYLVGRGAACDAKAVWTRGTIGAWDPRHSQWGDLPPGWFANHFALGMTFGGLRDIPTWWQPGEPEADASYAFIKQYCAFLRGHRALLGPRRMYTRVGVVISFPSWMWRTSPVFDLYGWEQRGAIFTVCDWLLDSDVPYDVVVLGHPAMWDDSVQLARLSRYGALVFPNADCLSDVQMSAIEGVAAAGCELFYTGELGTRDEEFNNRQGDLDFVRKVGATYLARDADTAERLRGFTPLRLAHQGGLRVTPWLSTEGDWITVHCYNKNYDWRSDVVTPTEPVSFSLVLPEGGEYPDVWSVSFEYEPRDLGAKVGEDGVLEVRLPPLEHWTMVVVGDAAEVTAAQAAAEARREADRELVRREAALREAWKAKH